MSFEIPQQLEYKEKIIFGLTFSQLLYAILFSPLALAILFKLSLDLPYRISLALIPSALACVFMFTKLPQHFLHWLQWLRWKSISKKRMEQFLSIEKIEQTIISTK